MIPRPSIIGAAAVVRRRLRPVGVRVPTLKTGPASGPGTVYLLCPDYRKPSGGIRTIYRHADILNAAGIDAVVVHHRPGFSADWFAHDTRLAASSRVRLSSRDVLVVPEVYGTSMLELPPEPTKVIFNQGAYLTFADASLDVADTRTPYRDLPGLAAVLVVSDDSAAYLRYAFPHLRVHRMRLGIDRHLYRPGKERRRPVLAFMPRRGGSDARQVVNLLKHRGALRGWKLQPIVGRSDTETADLLRASAIFLTFAHQEGFGLPPAEAMSCGCVVVGYPGQGGREFLREGLSLPVEQGDVVAFARRLEEAMACYAESPEAFSRMSERAAAFIAERYTPAQERSDVVMFYRSLVT